MRERGEVVRFVWVKAQTRQPAQSHVRRNQPSRRRALKVDIAQLAYSLSLSLTRWLARHG